MGNGFLFWEPSGQSLVSTIHLHLAPKLKKERSYTSAPPLGLMACSIVNITFTLVYTYIDLKLKDTFLQYYQKLLPGIFIIHY